MKCKRSPFSVTLYIGTRWRAAHWRHSTSYTIYKWLERCVTLQIILSYLKWARDILLDLCHEVCGQVASKTLSFATWFITQQDPHTKSNYSCKAFSAHSKWYTMPCAADCWPILVCTASYSLIVCLPLLCNLQANTIAGTIQTWCADITKKCEVSSSRSYRSISKKTLTES